MTPVYTWYVPDASVEWQKSCPFRKAMTRDAQRPTLLRTAARVATALWSAGWCAYYVRTHNLPFALVMGYLAGFFAARAREYWRIDP